MRRAPDAAEIAAHGLPPPLCRGAHSTDARAADADNRCIARTGASLRARKGAATPARAAGAPQAEAQEAAPRLRAPRPLGSRGDLHGLRHADGGGERPAGARERGRVPGRRELGALRRRPGLQGARQGRLPDREAHRQPQPHPRAGGRHLAPHQERGHSGRGPALLPARGPRLPRHRTRPDGRTSAAAAPPRAARRSPSSSSRTPSRRRPTARSSRSFASRRSPTTSSASGPRRRSSPST